MSENDFEIIQLNKIKVGQYFRMFGTYKVVRLEKHTVYAVGNEGVRHETAFFRIKQNVKLIPKLLGMLCVGE